MLRLLVSLVIFLSIAVDVFAQASFVARRNDNAATVQILTNGQLGALATDDRGRLFIVGSQYEDTAHVSGDGGVPALGVRQDSAVIPTTTSGDYSPLTVNEYGAPLVNVDQAFQRSTNLGLLKLEDAPHVSASAGVLGLAVANETLANLSGDGDYTPIATSIKGAVLANIDLNTQIAASRGILKQEDAVHTTADAGVAALSVRNTGFTTFAADQDYTPIGTGTYGNILSTIMYDAAVVNGNSPVNREDAVFGNQDATMMAGAVNNKTLTPFNTAAGDITPLAVGDAGNNLSTIVYDSTLSGTANSPVSREDLAFADSHSVIMMGAVNNRNNATYNTTQGDATPISVNDFGYVYTQEVGGTFGGGILYSHISAATNNSTNIKAAAGQVYSISACNSNAAIRYLKLYNKATAPTCGTDTPAMRIMIPANNCTDSISLPTGGAFSLGIGLCIVTGAADSDNTSTALNEQTVNITYR